MSKQAASRAALFLPENGVLAANRKKDYLP